MSEPHLLRTHTERRRDQARIEALEVALDQAQRMADLRDQAGEALQAELAAAKQHIDTLATAYTDALDALAEARWHNSGVALQNALWALVGAMATIVAMRWIP
jgi:hypothetical protein